MSEGARDIYERTCKCPEPCAFHPPPLDTRLLDQTRNHQSELTLAREIEEDQRYLKRLVRRVDTMFAKGMVNAVREARRDRPKEKPAPRARKPRKGFGK